MDDDKIKEEFEKRVLRRKEWMRGVYADRETNKYFLATDKGEILEWITEKGETFMFFGDTKRLWKDPCDLGNFVGLFDQEKYRIFDKETRRATAWITEGDKEIYTFEEVHDFGELVCIVHEGVPRLFEKKTRKAKEWMDERGATFHSFQGAFDSQHGSWVGITREGVLRFFDKLTGKFESLILEDGREHYVFQNAFCGTAPIVTVQSLDGRWQYVDPRTREIMDWTTHEGNVIYSVNDISNLGISYYRHTYLTPDDGKKRYFDPETRQEVDVDYD